MAPRKTTDRRLPISPSFVTIPLIGIGVKCRFGVMLGCGNCSGLDIRDHVLNDCARVGSYVILCTLVYKSPHIYT